MDGSAVFGLTLAHVPNLVNTLTSISTCDIEDIDYWLFHQANKFMLDYFAKKMGIQKEKMLMNISRFGNTSPPSIPLLMVTENLQSLGANKNIKLGLVGFGVGFSWGGAFINARNLVTPPLIYYRK